MKYVTAVMASYDAAVGRIEVGETYYVDDDKATRWVNAGLAKAGKAPPAVEELEDEGDEDPADTAGEDEDRDPEQLSLEAHKLHDDGLSERAIAQQLGISRPRVHSLLQS